MKQRFRFRWLVLLVPFLLGVYGYLLLYGNNWLGAVYSSLRLYGLNIDVPENDINIYIQVARWLAAAATTSVIMILFQRVFTEIGLRWKLRNPDVVVVHGDGPRKEAVTAAIGNPAVSMSGKTCFEAKKHVLAFESDAAAIRYLQENERKLLSKCDKEIYFVSYEYEPSDYAQQGLIVTNSAVNCARVYWKENWIKDSAEQKIAIIGCGRYAQRILEQALLVNVIAWRTPIEYHMFGSDGACFQKWHPKLSEVLAINQPDQQSDSVFFHPSVSEDGIANLKQMDRIIIAEDSHEANIMYLNKILYAGISGAIHVIGNRQLIHQLQYLPEGYLKNGQMKILSFGDDADMYSRTVIMHGELTRTAKEAHINYVQKSQAKNIRSKYMSCQGCRKNGKCDDCLQAKHTWDDLTPFEKASNIATADHAPVKRYLIAESDRHGGLDVAKKELCRIEHERWCRFYYLHNWSYGKKRDDGARIHPSLLPFDRLSETEQEKDWWAYSSMLSEEEKFYESV